MNSIPWNRINTALLLLVLLAMIGQFASRAYGGPLDPTDAPGSTDGVREPGTPISSIPFTITQPGRYYLTRNLTGAASTNGITIQQDNVVLDLRGFALLQSSLGTGDGVLVSGAHSGIRIEGGTIRGWFNGIDAATASNSQITGTTVLDGGIAPGDGGYAILIGASSVLEDCVVRNNKNSGPRLGVESTMRRCIISQQQGNGAVVDSRALVEGNLFENNASFVGYYGLLVDGNLAVVRNNSFSQPKDMLLTNLSSFAIVIDNTSFGCLSITDQGVSDTVPRDGSAHSNFVRGTVTC